MVRDRGKNTQSSDAGDDSIGVKHDDIDDAVDSDQAELDDSRVDDAPSDAPSDAEAEADPEADAREPVRTEASAEIQPQCAVEPTPVPIASGKPRRRWLRRLIGTVATLVVLALVAVLGVGWYYSDQVTAVNHQVAYDVLAKPGAGGTVELAKTDATTQPGTYGLSWDGGYGQVGPVQAVGETTVIRTFSPMTGALTDPVMAQLDSFSYVGDPRTALGLDYRQVQVPGELGQFPAWHVPLAGGDAGHTWIVFVHGHDSNRAESLRYLKTWHEAGYPVLVPTYRNDVGAPASPDGRGHLGDTEWRDVAAAVEWAVQSGAQDVVLAGWSMGGAVSLQVASRSDVGVQAAPHVRGLLLDSPVVSWDSVLYQQGSERGLPRPLTKVAIAMTQARFGVDTARFDWVERSRELSKPILVFANDSDTTVPPDAARELASKRSDLVTLVNVPAAGHCRGWNVDSAQVSDQMISWLHRVAPLPAAASVAAPR